MQKYAKMDGFESVAEWVGLFIDYEIVKAMDLELPKSKRQFGDTVHRARKNMQKRLRRVDAPERSP